MVLLQLFYFALIVFLVFYLPGRFLINLFKYEFTERIILHSASFAVGLSSFLLFTYFLSWLGLGFFYNIFILPIIFLEGKKIIKDFKLNNLEHPIEFFLIGLGSVSMFYLTAHSGLLTSEGIVFFSSNAIDGIYHLALVGNLIHHFPPTHPELANVPLAGYHFFYDFLVANINKFYRINSIDLLFRFFPFAIAFLYGLSLFAIGKFLNLGRYAIRLLLFLGFFGAGVEFILQKVSPNAIYNPGINPLILNIINPSVLLGMSLLFTFYILIFNKNKPKMVFLPAILLGILPQVKIYIAILGFASLGIIALIDLIKNRRIYYLKTLVEAGIVAFLVYVPFNLGSGGLILAPLLLYRHFMEQFSATWAQRFQIFESYSNIPQMIILYFQAFLLFFLPTLGLRLISMLQVNKLKEKKFYSPQNIFWISFILLGILLASLFIQTEDVFNIVQFLWPVYILILIPTSIAIASLVRNNNTFKIIVFILIVAISSIPNLKVFEAYSTDKTIIDSQTLKMTNFIKNHISQDKGIMLVNPHNLPQISALSEHEIFYEPTITSFKQSKLINESRSKTVGDLNNLLTLCTGDVGNQLKKILSETNNDYLLTLKSYNCINSIPYLKEIAVFGDKYLYQLTP